MPVTPYAEPQIAANIAQPWPQQVEVRLSMLTARCDAFHVRLAAVERWLDDNDGLFVDLRQQIADLRASNSALIEAMLKTDGDDDDADF